MNNWIRLTRTFLNLRRSRLWMLLGGLALVLILGGLLAGPSFAASTATSAVVRAGGASLYAGPDGEELATLAGGDIVSAVGRNAGQTWIAVQAPDGTAGWLRAETLLAADLAALPIMETGETAVSMPATPVPLPTVTPTAVPTAAATAAPAIPAGEVAADERTTTAQSIAAQATTQPVMGIVATQGADLLDAPGGSLVTHLAPGTLVHVMARSSDSTVMLVQRRDELAVQGWAAAAQLYLADVTLVPLLATDGDTPQPDPMTAAEGRPGAVTATVTSGSDRLNIRSGPGTGYSVVAKALDGEIYTVIARNDASTWLQIDTTRGHAAGYGVESGWIAAEYVTPSGDVDMLPVGVVEALPATPAPSATPSPGGGSKLLDANTSSAAEPELSSAAATAASLEGLSGTLVFQTGPGGTIYAYSLDSGALWPLTHGFDPAISPDGQTVAFVRDGGENGLYLIDIGGSDERLIFSGRARLSSPKWSPDGNWIVFTRSDEYVECYQIGPGCITPDQLPPGMEIDESETPLVRQYSYKLARVDRDGSSYRDLATLNSARAADWNEAGIVYQSDAGLQLTSDTPDAENQLVVYDYLKPWYADPDWQPQGGKIVYMGKEASHWEIFTINPDGTGQAALTRPATTLVDEIPSNVSPAWSPDGQHIVFLSNRTDSHEAGAWQLWVMDADGSNPRALPIDVTLEYTYGGEQAVSWGL